MPEVTLEAVGDCKQLEALVRGTQPLPTWESLNPEIAVVTRAGTVLPLVNVEIRAASAASGSPALI